MDSLKEKPTLSDKDSAGPEVERLNESNSGAESSTDISLNIVDSDFLDPSQAEHRVVSALLRFGSACSLNAKPKHFFNPLLALIFAHAIARCNDAGYSEELVAQSLDASGELRMVGGLAFLADLSLFQAPPTPDAIGYWDAKIIDGWHRRESLILLSTALESFRDGDAVEDAWRAIGTGYRALKEDC